MNQEEIYCRLAEYACDVLSFEERRSIPLSEWEGFVKAHFEPIPKSELKVGETYNGACRNGSKAIWKGDRFTYTRYKFGDTFEEDINHYEDDEDDGYDIFVPIRYVQKEKI